MTLRQLEIFCAIVDTGGFHAAAQQLYLAQPSVSQQIKALEDELGQQLFLRSPRRPIQITEAGHMFFENAERILRICQKARSEVAALASEPAGQLRVGMARHQLRGTLPAALVAFHNRFPKIRVELLNGATQQLLHYLRTDRLDLGIVNLPIDSKGLECETLLTEEFVLVVRKDSAMPPKPSVDAQLIASLPLITYGRSSATRHKLDAYFAQAGIDPNITFEASSVETMKEMVAAGLGASILPASVVLDDAHSRNLRYFSISGRPLYRSVGLVTALHQQFPIVLEYLRNSIRQGMAEVGPRLARKGLCLNSSGGARERTPNDREVDAGKQIVNASPAPKAASVGSGKAQKGPLHRPSFGA